MKKSRLKITAVLLMAVFSLTGCGESLYELTMEEEAAIVSYASHTVAKFNKYQEDGEVCLLTEESVEDTENIEDTDVVDQEAATEEMSAEKTDNTSMKENTEGNFMNATMTEALDLGVIAAEYMGYELCTTYKQSDVYAVDADTGEQLLVLKVNLTNQVNQNLHIDILAMVPEFRAIINGTETIAAQTTILPEDLSTYQQDILAGATNETVILFQIPQEITEISTIQLKITMNGRNYMVNL